MALSPLLRGSWGGADREELDGSKAPSESASRLTALDVRGCKGITEVALAQLFLAHGALYVILLCLWVRGLHGCKGITHVALGSLFLAHGVVGVARSCPEG